ncbi:DUF2306 domain-containing protein [Gymnodinialimonas hymeniacidonis]|uniref:DUF2306 domain-containing protein n=1 Tax=Gymnodinialimonas hymeniacidonis TaxID=3126508 RepID=UPI0034C6BADD
MTLSPLTTADPVIQVHVACALISIVLGPFVLLRKRRDRLHRITGYVWVLAMAALALSSFGIREFALIGPLSPIHALAVLTLWSLWVGVRHAVQGRYWAHHIVFRNLYWYGLLVAGTFNFLPGRRMNAVVFGGRDELGLWLIGAVAVAVALYHLNRRPRAGALA